MKQLILLSLLLSLVACQPSSTAIAPPVVQAGPDITVEDTDKNGVQAVQLNGSATDNDSNIGGYQVLVKDQVVANGRDVSVFQKSLELPVGTHTVILIATDLEGLSGSDSLTVNVVAPKEVANTKPVVNAGPDFTVVDEDGDGSETVKLLGSATDAENNIVKYRVHKNGQTHAGGTVPYIFIQNIPLPVGSHTMTFEATDAAGLVGTDTVVITVVAKAVIKHPPIVKAGPDLSAVAGSNNLGSVTLQGSASDQDNDIANYYVKMGSTVLKSGTSASVLTSTLSLSTGSHTLTLEAVDAGGLKSSDSMIVTISPHIPAPATVAGNLMVNGSFESSINGWNLWSNSSSMAGNNFDGSSALRIGSAAGGMEQNILDKVVVGAKYRLEGMLKLGASSEVGWFGVEFKNAAGESLLKTAPQIKSTFYQKYSSEFIVPAGANKGFVWFWKTAGSSYMYADAITLVKIAEPAPTPTPPQVALSGVVAEGDSISIFWGGNYTGIFAKNHTTVPFSGLAVGGSGLSGLNSRQATALSKNAKVLSVLIGANDLHNFVPSTYAAELFKYTDAFRAKGTKVAVATVLPQSVGNYAAFNTKRKELNQLIRAAVGSRIDAVIDFAADSEMGDDADAMNKTYYPDGLHPSDPTHGALNGHSRLAAIYTPVMESLLGLASSNTAPVISAGNSLSAIADSSGMGSVTLRGSAIDKENNITSYAVKNGSTVLKSGSSASVLTSTVSLATGSYNLTLEATDAGNLKGSANVSVTISAPAPTPPPVAGSGPVANAGPDRISELVNLSGKVDFITFSGSASAGSNAIAKYVWKINNVIVETSSSSTTLTDRRYPFIKGNNLLTLEVTDTAGVKAVDHALVIIKPSLKEPDNSNHSADWSKNLFFKTSQLGAFSLSAGGQRIVIDEDNDGFETVRMTGAFTTTIPAGWYVWHDRGSAKIWAEGPDASVLTANIKFPMGKHSLELRAYKTSAKDPYEVIAGDTMSVDVTKPVKEYIPSIPSNFDKQLYLTTGSAGTAHWKDQSAFRFTCKPSHLLYDDPIVFPGQPGKAHLHMFFGNTKANANSTYESLRTSGDNSCEGGPLNRSAYWMPALMNENGKVVVADYITIYYKSHPGGNRTIPRGLRMIFGYDHSTGTTQKHRAKWKCEGGGPEGYSIAELNCPAGSRIGVALSTPTCWDGVNLDSPNHRDHVSHNVNGSCPSTHPVRMTAFTMIAWFTHTGSAEYSKWRLSSDHTMPHDSTSAALPGGTSMHADWFGAWDDEVLHKWHDQCLSQHLSCNNATLGNGPNNKLKSTINLNFTANPRIVDPPVKPTN